MRSAWASGAGDRRRGRLPASGRSRPLLFLVALASWGLLLFGPRIAGTRRGSWSAVSRSSLRVRKLVAALFAAKVFSESKKEDLGLLDIPLPGWRSGSCSC